MQVMILIAWYGQNKIKLKDHFKHTKLSRTNKNIKESLIAISDSLFTILYIY